MNIRQEDILSYNPDLDISSSPSSNPILDEEDKTIGYIEEDSNKSNMVREFEYQKPSMQLNDLSKLLDEIKEFKNKIENNENDNDYLNKYLNTTDTKEINNIIDKNKNDLENGSTLLEVYTALEEIEKEINDIINNYILCMFGKDVDIDTANKLEQAYIDKINQLETDREYEKINYFNLYYDCQISYLLREYITKLRKICMDLGYLKNKHSDTKNDKLLISMFKDQFSLINKDQSQEEILSKDCCENMITAMNNIFLTKNKINKYFDIYSNLSLYGDCIEDIIKIKDNNIQDLESKLDNLIKAAMRSIVSKEDKLAILNKKINYRSFFI